MTLKKVYLSTMIAALGGLLFGFDTAVISGTTDALQKHFSLSEAMLGFTVATALIATTPYTVHEKASPPNCALTHFWIIRANGIVA